MAVDPAEHPVTWPALLIPKPCVLNAPKVPRSSSARCCSVPPQTAFAEHDQVIQALPANAANHALNIRPLEGDRGADSTSWMPIAFT